LLHVNTKKLIEGFKEVSPADQEELDMLQFFFNMENGDLDLANFKAKTLENILERYYQGTWKNSFEYNLRIFYLSRENLKNLKGGFKNGSGLSIGFF